MITVNITKEAKDGGRIELDFDKHGKIRVFAKDCPEFDMDELVSLSNEISKTIIFVRGYA